jgi:uncharacterized protein YraI
MRRPLLIILLLAIFSAPVAAQVAPNGQVKRMATTLRLRAAPFPTAEVIAELTAGTALTVHGRTFGDGWLNVETPDAQTGWVAAGYVELFVALDAIPVITPAAPSSTAVPPTGEVQPAPVDQPVEGADAYVRQIGGTLRLRQEATTASAILAELPPGTPLDVLGRTADGLWLNVAAPDGQSGWVFAAYVSIGVQAPVVAATDPDNAPPAAGVRGVAAIAARGRALGSQRHVFTTIGDSMTVSAESLDAIGRGIYSLGGFGGLQHVIDVYMGGGFNSFTHDSAAAGAGWTTTTALEPQFRNTALCQAEISAVECELDRVKPAVALIQLGTNDLLYLSPDQFAYNIGRIVDLCIEKGVVPVLATIPYRDGFGAGVDAFNEIIRGTAAARGIPLWDVKGALDGLPNRGLSGDGIHPSSAPGGYADSANFANAEALLAGSVARNLSALLILDGTLSAMGG